MRDIKLIPGDVVLSELVSGDLIYVGPHPHASEFGVFMNESWVLCGVRFDRVSAKAVNEKEASQ